MPIQVPIAAQLAIGSFNATSTSNQVGWNVDVATRESTTWGSGVYQQFVPSLRTLDVSFGGFNDFDAAAWDEYARVFPATQILTLAHDTAAAGTAAVMANGLVTNQANFNANVGDIPTINPRVVGGTVYPPLAEGLVTRATSAGNITATTTTTPVQLGTLAATQHIVAAVHVFSYSGTGTITCQIQSAATSGGTYTNRGSAGPAISAAGAQWITATGITTTNPWWRLNITASASPVALVLASIAIFTP